MIDKKRIFPVILAFFMVLSFAPQLHAQTFSQQVGTVKVGDVDDTKAIQVPFITWGGDMVTFYANGGLKTAKGSIFDQLGLNINLVSRDDLYVQSREYMEGKSPFLRGTFRMMGQVSELISSDPKTEGVMVLQLTWSAGDHCVIRKGIKTISDPQRQKNCSAARRAACRYAGRYSAHQQIIMG